MQPVFVQVCVRLAVVPVSVRVQVYKQLAGIVLGKLQCVAEHDNVVGAEHCRSSIDISPGAIYPTRISMIDSQFVGKAVDGQAELIRLTQTVIAKILYRRPEVYRDRLAVNQVCRGVDRQCAGGSIETERAGDVAAY